MSTFGPGKRLMEFRARSKTHALNDLLAKLRDLPIGHPYAPRLFVIARGLHDEVRREMHPRLRAVMASTYE
jgi:hypothetical protein